MMFKKNTQLARTSKSFLGTFGVAFIWFLIIDGVWLGLIAGNFYQEQLGHVLSDTVQWYPALLFYIVFVLGLTYFVLLSYPKDSFVNKVIDGALFTFIAYATYDLTNQATIIGWPTIVTVMDMLWAMVLGSSVTAFTLMTLERVKKKKIFF